MPGETPDADAVVSFGAPLPPEPAVPTLSFAVSAHAEPAGTAATSVWIADSPLVARPVRGRTLDETGSTVPALDLEAGWIPLASTPAGVAWAASADGPPAHRAALPPEELQAGETLRDQLRPGRFMALLPLIEFIRAIGGAPASTLRAALMLDDPNLHWTTYGYASYPALARHAQEHGYHIAMGMIPLDGWFAQGRAVELFNASRPWLSLLMHGNDHVHRELAQPKSAAAATAMLAQALRRIESFERRTGARVDRVMAPPHGAYSLASARAMLQVGIEALCANYAAVDADAGRDDALAGWREAEFVAGGLPVLSRYHFDEPREELAFRALLGQPLILYGHHQDLAHGLDVLEQAAADVNALGSVHWTSIGDIAASNYETWQRDSTLQVRLFSRRATVAVPPGVSRMVVEAPGHDSCADETVRSSGRETREARFEDGVASLPLDGETTVVLSLAHLGALDPASVPSPRPKPWPVLRRLLTESRDRLSPALSR